MKLVVSASAPPVPWDVCEACKHNKTVILIEGFVYLCRRCAKTIARQIPLVLNKRRAK